MDQPKRPADKTYSEVMNEWAAQRNFVQGSRSRLLHPPYQAHPLMKLLGYLGRMLVVLVLPVAVYLVLLRGYGRSKEFNTMLSAGAATVLQAEKATTIGAVWEFDGMMVLKSLEATGRPEAFFDRLEARHIGTRVPIPGVFRRDWILPRVSIGDLTIALRSGGLGQLPLYELDHELDDELRLPGLPPAATPAPKTGMQGAPPPAVLRAGYGIAPDFKTLRINAVQTARLNASWGSGQATAGSLTGMQTDLTRMGAGWVISGNGGNLRQSWLDGMQVDKLAVTIVPGKAVIDEVVFTRLGGGKSRLSGSMTLGEMPELNAELKLESVRLHDLVPTAASGLFTAEAGGSVRLSGSVNRSTGIKMEGTLDLRSGRLTGVPVMKALHQLTGEDQFRQLTLRSGKIVFTTSGSEGHGGLVVDIKEFEADCGPVARLKGSFRQEEIREAAARPGGKPVARLKVSGHFQIGVPAMVVAKLKPAVAARFFKPGEGGWSWLDCPIEGPISGSLSRELAEELLKADSTAAP